MRKLLGLAVVTGALMVSACNTVEGVGKDVSSAGNTVAKTAGKGDPELDDILADMPPEDRAKGEAAARKWIGNNVK